MAMARHMFADERDPGPDLVVSGESNLLEVPELGDVRKLRRLFDAFNTARPAAPARPLPAIERGADLHWRRVGVFGARRVQRGGRALPGRRRIVGDARACRPDPACLRERHPIVDVTPGCSAEPCPWIAADRRVENRQPQPHAKRAGRPVCRPTDSIYSENQVPSAMTSTDPARPDAALPRRRPRPTRSTPSRRARSCPVPRRPNTSTDSCVPRPRPRTRAAAPRPTSPAPTSSPSSGSPRDLA